ncbi:NUDIX hydrolase [Ferrimonas balearica]|uniref:NUDIX hydrolase n=1 Tax=Ferrimonas balearica TaxID=44012 RepID=UPI001C993C90|nr:NUDIX domain-containing protein [Ferrimonas balearica]MBY5993542.1 NUDIX domain-containing protein [Ferrimonas balearica]
METIHSLTHPDAVDNGSEFTRVAVRALIARGSQVLLLYTERYDDFSLPGGGVDEGESLEAALLREVTEETGARDLKILAEFGLVEELRPWYKPQSDNVRMLSYCYLCDAHPQLGETALEHYEQANGMAPRWVELSEAIAHNEAVMAGSPKAGLSIARETWLLKRLARHLQLAA